MIISMKMDMLISFTLKLSHLDLGQLFDRSGEYEELRTEISQIQSKLEESKKKNISNKSEN